LGLFWGQNLFLLWIRFALAVPKGLMIVGLFIDIVPEIEWHCECVAKEKKRDPQIAFGSR
jgi:hypothetical protein